MEKIDFCKAEKVKGEENQMEEKKTNQQSRVAESEIIIETASEPFPLSASFSATTDATPK